MPATSAALGLRIGEVETLISAAALAVGLVVLWSWRRGLEVSSFQASLLSAIEVAGFVLAVVALGWLGVAIFVVVSLAALLVWSVVLAIKKQSILVDATVQGAEVSQGDAEEIWQWMKGEESFAALPPLKRAELIKVLASQARKPAEIRAMAIPIAQLALIFGCDAVWLSPRFDQLLRLYGHDAGEATKMADSLTASTQLAAASFEEMVEAMLTAGGAGPLEATEAFEDMASKDQFRDTLRANAELEIREAGEDGIRLNGGPMDGWLVLKDAPSLAADWHKTWPPSVADENAPGRYEMADGGTWAEWVPLEPENEAAE